MRLLTKSHNVWLYGLMAGHFQPKVMDDDDTRSRKNTALMQAYYQPAGEGKAIGKVMQLQQTTCTVCLVCTAEEGSLQVRLSSCIRRM